MKGKWPVIIFLACVGVIGVVVYKNMKKEKELEDASKTA